MIGVGDDGVRKVLGIPAGEKAPDFVTVTKGNDLVLSEAKGLDTRTGKVDVESALQQLKRGMEGVTANGLAGDLKRVEFMMPKGAPLNINDLGVKDGYLITWSTGERITLKGFTNLVMVIEL